MEDTSDCCCVLCGCVEVVTALGEHLYVKSNRDHYMSLEMLEIAAVRIRFKAYGQKLFSCLALRASRIR